MKPLTVVSKNGYWTKEEALGYIDSISMVLGGGHNLAFQAYRIKAHKTAEITLWDMSKKLGCHIRYSEEERQKIEDELRAEDPSISNRAIADILGVNEKTVRNDTNAENSADNNSTSREVDGGSAENSAIGGESSEASDARSGKNLPVGGESSEEADKETSANAEFGDESQEFSEELDSKSAANAADQEEAIRSIKRRMLEAPGPAPEEEVTNTGKIEPWDESEECLCEEDDKKIGDRTKRLVDRLISEFPG